MRFSVRHATAYRYERPVQLAGHRLRFRPRGDRGRLVAYELRVTPDPARWDDRLDAFGNAVAHIDFEGATDRLVIESRFEFETALAGVPNASGLPRLPWPPLTGDAAVYNSPVPEASEIRMFAARLAAEDGGDPVAFLNRLNARLYEDFDHKLRFDGAARTPVETLALGGGACRDMTVLFMAACRSLGLPARFVSGYQARAETPDGRRHLHAWPEAYLPDWGWRGFDPTHGVCVDDGHVALCAAPTQAATMTVEGGYFGDKVDSTLDYDIAVAAD